MKIWDPKHVNWSYGHGKPVWFIEFLRFTTVYIPAFFITCYLSYHIGILTRELIK